MRSGEVTKSSTGTTRNLIRTIPAYKAPILTTNTFHQTSSITGFQPPVSDLLPPTSLYLSKRLKIS